MTHVYVVLIGYNHEGYDIDSIWSSQERANSRLDDLEKDKIGDYNKIQVIPVDDLRMLQG